ncbi:ABC transporter ATP-binding protein [Candidatus Aerophobetes bacterium]|nr:ABC transporter ATP-binding protein [Candidatus Aerophobetes bacterium]
MQPIVEINEVTKIYDKVKAVDGISLRINEGEIFGFLGPNGAGKTTTILMLLGLTEPTSGEVKVFGYNATRNPLQVKRKTGYLPENVGFYEDLTARENLFYITALNGIKRDKASMKIEEVLSLVGLMDAADKEVGKFSRGMIQRLGIAATLVKEPKLVILDEPTLGIDPEGVEQVLNIIKKLGKEEKITILLSSHLLHQVQKICDRICIISQGKIVVEGSLDEVGKRIIGEGRIQIQVQVSEVSRELLDSLKEIQGVEEVEVSGNLLNIRCEKDLREQISRRVIEKGAVPLLLKTQDYTLEEIYVRYFREG